MQDNEIGLDYGYQKILEKMEALNKVLETMLNSGKIAPDAAGWFKGEFARVSMHCQEGIRAVEEEKKAPQY